MSRYNSLVTRNEQLTDIIEKNQKEFAKEREILKTEMRRLEQQSTSDASHKSKQITELERNKETL